MQKDAASDSRNTTGPAISPGSASLPIGVSSAKRSTSAATSGRRFIGVSV